MKRIFIVNPVAGGRDAGVELERRLPQAAAAAGLAAEEYTIVRTEYAGHAKQLAELCIVEPIFLFVPYLDRPILDLSIDPPNGRIGRNIAIIINTAACQLGKPRLHAKTVFV